ncbi:DUF7146 domain-containing protein [Porphyrobacter sp. CACIAM 03H1]|uniref:DUF7146 domain-containing protein n=1 Tax=Porphyrobacter sp. CACIAM 03H1 TaxID=2003315 RepID=UPI000B5A846A|nr:toprim domain-containing protein [Porphyrobacter sp. CACIAM 03H1]ASJ91144.1 hypothetical protein CBR61_09595 [Porphyrobacter sp. CACIAM 03H1]
MTGARELTLALGGRWHGRYGAAPCPMCQPDRRRDQNALTLSDGRSGLLLHCKRAACDFCDILAAAGVIDGNYRALDPADFAKRAAEAKVQAARRAEAAHQLWSEGLPIDGTPAETYLRGRGISCPLPDRLRFHPHCWHGPSGARFPAMVALVEGGSGFAVHRTYLRPDGRGKAGLAGGDKLMLGATAGGAVRLSGGAVRVAITEGIESGLSLLCGLLAGPVAVWAALSTSGMRALRLPEQSGQLVIAGDGDQPGREAAHVLANRAHALGWRVSLIDPGEGADFNDILTGKAVAA